MVLATLFGLTLTLYPLFIKVNDRSYLALIPSVGIITLNLVIYGCVFYHQLLSPQYGLILISMVGVLSLWMLSRFKEETYAIMAIAGTFIGAIALKNGFSSLNYIACYLIAWNIIFSLTAIKLKIRFIVVFSAFFSFFTVSLLSLAGQVDFKCPIISLQIFQAALYSFAVAAYSIINKAKLTAKETQQFFPVFLFFYGHVFYLLNAINPHFATFFAVFFSVGLLILLQFTKSKLNAEKMDSSSFIYTFVTIMLSQSLFFVAMNDLARFVTVAIILLLARVLLDKPSRPEFRGVKIVLGLLVAYGILDLSFNPEITDHWILSLFGFFYGVIALSSMSQTICERKNFSELILFGAHSQMMIAIYRLKEFVGVYGVPPLWTVYAFFILYRGMKQQDATIGKSSFPVIFFAIVYFLTTTFSQLDQGQRIISLLVMGGLIYACGYFYRKITLPI